MASCFHKQDQCVAPCERRVADCEPFIAGYPEGGKLPAQSIIQICDAVAAQSDTIRAIAQERSS
jgi:hypothetical protein